MAIEVDLSKPLTEEQIADLRTRLPNELVEHYIAQSNGEFEGEAETKAKPAAKTTAAKKDDDLLK